MVIEPHPNKEGFTLSFNFMIGSACNFCDKIIVPLCHHRHDTSLDDEKWWTITLLNILKSPDLYPAATQGYATSPICRGNIQTCVKASLQKISNLSIIIVLRLHVRVI